MEYLIYLLKFSVLVGLFWMVYEIFLKKETFYQIKRIYLTAGIVLSAILPITHITLTNNSEKGVFHETLQSIQLQNITSNDSFQAAAPGEISFISILLGCYFLGGLFFLIRYLTAFQKLNNLLKTTQLKPYKNHIKYCISSQQIEPFSFFNRIVINPKQHSPEELNHILRHEEAHIKLKHSFDVVFIKLICCLNWFNPLIWIYQKRMLQNIEMQADDTAIQQVESTKAYQYTLVKNSLSTKRFLPVNYFNQPFLKTRIMMLNRKKSTPQSVLKIGIILPLLVAFFIGFQLNLQAQETQKTTMPVQKDTESVPFSAIQQAPVYPGCEDAADLKEQKQCMSKKIQEFVSEHFELDTFKKDSTLTGTQRINVQFTIDEEGKVSEILSRAKRKDLENEARRVIGLLPSMKPGMLNDHPVSVVYTLPIVFKVDDTKQAE